MNNITKRLFLTPLNIIYLISPKFALQLIFLIKQRHKLNLNVPKSYNEKLQWIKLYDHNPLMPKCCDKYEVRSFVKECHCEKILNNLIWEGYDPEKIPFDKLPTKYVIKATHGSTFNIICDNSKKIDRQKTIKQCKKWLQEDKFLPCYGEWFYGIIKPRIIIEDYIESTDDNQLRDYKVFCFNGEPKLIRVDTDRFTDHKDSIFDTEWNLLKDKHMGHGCGNRVIKKPEKLKELLNYARIFSKPFLHARVDFYITRDRIIFGEITFTNGAGFDRFSSHDFDVQIGNYLKLPINK